MKLDTKKSDGATKRYPLKLVVDDPISGVPVRKEESFTLDEILRMAQQGYRFNDKMKNYKENVQREAKSVARDLIEDEVNRRVSLALGGRQEPSREKDDYEELNPEDPDYPNKRIDKLEKTISTLVDRLEGQQKEKDRIDKLTAEYNRELNTIFTENPDIDRDKLIGLVKTSRVPPEGIREFVNLLGSSIYNLQSKDADGKPDKTGSKELEEALGNELEAPDAGGEGVETSKSIGKDDDAKPTKPATRESLFDAAIEKLNQMQEEGIVD